MSNLVGWWPLHENQGQAQDLSGNGNHGTLNGGITQGVAGKMGQTAYSFDGSDDVVKTSQQISSNKFTVSFWTRPKSLNNSHIVQTVREGGTWLDNGFSVNMKSDDSIDLQLRDNGSNNDVTGSVLTKNKWHHICATFDGNRGSIYLNGDLDITKSSLSYNPSTASPDIGAAEDQQFYHGNITDVRIYNRALTSQEILRLYQWGNQDYTKPKYHNGNDTGAISRFKFNGNISDNWGTVSDSEISDNTSAGYGNGIRGKAKKFNGTDDYINLGNSSSLDLGTASDATATWTAWVKPASVKTQRIVSSQNSNDGPEILNTRFNNDGSVQLLIDDSDSIRVYAQSESSKYNSGNWYFYTGVLQNGTAKVYLNGTQIARDSASFTGNLNWSASLEIGRYEGGPSDHWNGLIDDIRLYKRALSPNEVFQLYQWGTKGRDMRKLTLNSKGDR